MEVFGIQHCDGQGPQGWSPYDAGSRHDRTDELMQPSLSCL
jgi:hypothetical protein